MHQREQGRLGQVEPKDQLGRPRHDELHVHLGGGAIPNFNKRGVRFKDLGFGQGMQVRVVVRVMHGDLELERVPHERHVTFTVPDQAFEGAMWRA